MEPFVNSCNALPAAPHMANLHALVDGMKQACATKEPAVVAALVKKAVESILEGLTPQANQVGIVKIRMLTKVIYDYNCNKK